MLSLMFKTKSRMDSGIYISSDYSRLRATPIQSESSSMQVPTHKMSETMTETCRKRNSLSVSRILSRKRASDNNRQTNVGDFVGEPIKNNKLKAESVSRKEYLLSKMTCTNQYCCKAN